MENIVIQMWREVLGGYMCSGARGALITKNWPKKKDRKRKAREKVAGRGGWEERARGRGTSRRAHVTATLAGAREKKDKGTGGARRGAQPGAATAERHTAAQKAAAPRTAPRARLHRASQATPRCWK